MKGREKTVKQKEKARGRKKTWMCSDEKVERERRMEVEVKRWKGKKEWK